MGTKSRILTLPPEILLHGILFRVYPPDHYWRISELALVCHYFNSLLTPHLYSRVDVSMTGAKEPDDDEEDEEDSSVVEEWGLKAKLMRTLALNPTLAAHVRKWYEYKAEPLEMEKEMGGIKPEDIAANLINLEDCVLPNPNDMMDYMVSNVHNFKNLKRLKALCPVELFNDWGKDNKTLQLEELNITTWHENEKSDPVEGKTMNILGLINLFLMTCPALQSLDIKRYNNRDYSFVSKAKRKNESHLGILTARDNIPQHRPVQAAVLKHFGIEYMFPPEEHQALSSETIYGFVKELFDNNPGRLTSFKWNLNQYHTQNFPIRKDLVQKMKHDIKIFDGAIIPSLSGLKRLKLTRTEWLEENKVASSHQAGSSKRLNRVLSYIQESHPELEELTLREGYNFMKDVVTMGDGTKSGIRLNCLRKLKLKITLPYDRSEMEHEYADKGWLKTERFFPFIWKFILRLPRSLESLQIEIGADEYLLEDEDFSPVSSWAIPLFLEFGSLHFFNFRLFTTDANGGARRHPENELIVVRHPRQNGKKGKVLRKLWLKNVYQHYEHRRILYQDDVLLARTWEKEEEGKLQQVIDDVAADVFLEWFGGVEDDGRDVKDDEQKFLGEDGKDWWFPRVEYERMRFRCRLDDCEELERKRLPMELRYHGTLDDEF